ncbi:stage II sporulation protein M [Virgibacillus sp. MSJ-26]|uniref:stage II sporulation protein M n=1 Tax=Virgibacillus sp. MSJ-26 TaxID=2841522 RepID=UPI001C0FC75C|nr:stage II sporulation protein M [Virgibacillus sp. MSJ-26]MBU5466323.1 stage II sporulation protein M [Virgibacillus sp. MSJ-26]
MYKKRNVAINHVKEHATVYVFMIILFLTGIIFGAILVNSMNFVQKQDLFFYLERFFLQIQEGNSIEKNEVFKSSFFYHAKYLFLLLILGLSVIGLPIVWILLFLKGLVVGFSVGFLVNQIGLKGFFLAALSIAPQNILTIPLYIVAGSFAMIFSLTLLNKLFSRKISKPIIQPLIQYLVIFSLLIALSVIAATIEAYVASYAMESLIASGSQ